MNPQTMIMGPVTEAVNDTFIGIGMGLPIPRLPIMKGRSLVIELLKVKFIVEGFTAALASTNQYYMNITTNPTVPANFAIASEDPRTIADWFLAIIVGAAAGAIQFPLEHVVDLTDEAGHGILIATDNLYMNIGSANTGTHTWSGVARLSYRFKDVSLEEYIGIVQSQQ